MFAAIMVNRTVKIQIERSKTYMITTDGGAKSGSGTIVRYSVALVCL